MTIIVRGKGFDLTEAIKDYAEEKVTRLFTYSNKIDSIDVILSGQSKKGFNIEIIAHGDREKIIGKENNKDLYKGIDQCKKTIKEQLLRQKESFHKA